MIYTKYSQEIYSFFNSRFIVIKIYFCIPCVYTIVYCSLFTNLVDPINISTACFCFQEYFPFTFAPHLGSL